VKKSFGALHEHSGGGLVVCPSRAGDFALSLKVAMTLERACVARAPDV
jgi:hypothetical protein